MPLRNTKGRDLYDLGWYLADPNWPSPNLTLLNNALQQTNWAGPELTDVSWRSVVAVHLDRVDWQRARQDLLPFIVRRQELELVERETLKKLLIG